jgi:hypothetical protein
VLIVVAALVAGLAVGAGAVVALSGGSDSNTKSVNAGATTSSVPAGGGGGFSGGGGSSGSGSGTSKATGPKPVFTQASASPTTVICDSSANTPSLVLSWNAENADRVERSGSGFANLPTHSTVNFSSLACKQGGVTLVAHGPGGDTATTISWRHISSSEAHKAISP